MTYCRNTWVFSTVLRGNPQLTGLPGGLTTPKPLLNPQKWGFWQHPSGYAP
jgi:hypothetical protein